MRKLILTSRFKRSLKKFIQKNPALQKQVEITLLQMAEDIFAPSLMTHKLKGDLEGLRSCSCGYDCRIIFSLEKNPVSKEENIVILNIGTHDEVY